jgi:hypothetical protein
MQQLVIVQVIDPLGLAIGLEIGGGADHPLLGFADLSGAKRAVLQLTDTDRHVEPFRDQLDVAIVQLHVHRDLGVLPQEAAENG